MKRVKMTLPRIVPALALVALAGCGGGSTGPTPVLTPTPRPTATNVVIQGGQGLEANHIQRLVFTTPVAGRIDVTVDWQLDSDDLDVYVARGSCNFDQFFGGQCEVLGRSESRTAKPETASVASAAAGRYTLFIGNHGPHDESYSWKVVVTPEAAAASAR